MKTQKFNLEAYKENLRNEIATLTAKVAEMETNRYAHFWEIRNLKDKIEDLNLLLDPKFVCEYCYSDRHAYEVLRMESDKRMIVRQLMAKRTDNNGMSDAQAYAFTEDLNAPEITLRLHKNGKWYESGNCNPFGLTSEPYEYYDYSF